MSLFQSNLRKQIRNLPKILNFVKKIHYYCELFTSLLGPDCRELHYASWAGDQSERRDADERTDIRLGRARVDMRDIDQTIVREVRGHRCGGAGSGR